MSQASQPKIGLEIHQQLDTDTKLFCSCATAAGNKQEKEIERRLRPVASELGEIDPASRYEHTRRNHFYYQYYDNSCCLVETDEEPPHSINRQALRIALTIAGLLDCEVPDEIHVMRKIVIDGSCVSGFQRTCKIGSQGKIELEDSELGISDLELEEDAAKIVSRDEKTVYDLSRSGVPLIEIGTKPDITSPGEAKEAALKLGSILRSTREVRRGIGTIRQDVNISIPEGARVEIKGFQDVKNIDSLIEKELERQERLVELRDELEKRQKEIYQLKATDKEQNKALLHLPDFLSHLQRDLGGKTLYEELKPYVAAYGAQVDLITADNLDDHDWDEIVESELDASDCLLLVKLPVEEAGKQEGERDLTGGRLEKSLTSLRGRLDMLATAVPEETRVANADQTSSYSRPLPGEARLYPETDILPLALDSDWLEEINSNLPETFSAKKERFAEEIGQELAEQVVKSDHLDLYEQFVDRFDLEPKFIANMFTNTIKDLETRKDVDVSSLTEEDYSQILERVAADKVSQDSVAIILEEKSASPEKTIGEIIEAKELEKSDESEVRTVVNELVEARQEMIKQQGMHAKKALMGEVMGKLRGKADGSRVNQLLQEKLEEVLDED